MQNGHDIYLLGYWKDVKGRSEPGIKEEEEDLKLNFIEFQTLNTFRK